MLQQLFKDKYFIVKRSGTYSDTLAAYGLAAVLDELIAQARGREYSRQVLISDEGSHYMLSLNLTLQPSYFGNCTPFTVVPFVRRKNVEPPVGYPSDWVRDFLEEQEASNRYWQLRKAASTNNLKDEVVPSMADPPRSDYRTLECIADYKFQITGTTRGAGYQSYNRIAVKWWQYQKYLAVNLRYLLRLGADIHTDLDQLALQWAKDTNLSAAFSRDTASGLLNPSQSQGQNEPKASRLDTRQNIEEFWLLEYLKAAGMWLCAAPRRIRPPKREPKQPDWNKADRKVYVLAPNRLTLGQHIGSFSRFSRRFSSETSITQDIVSVLLFVQAWLDYVEASQEDEFDFDLDPDAGIPEKVVGGFHVVQYKLLSQNSYTVTHIDFIELPRWTGKPRNRSEVLRMKRIIDEHLRVVRGIDETRSDGYYLLLQYRSFVTGRQWDAFFDFVIGYSNYLMGEQHRAYSKEEQPQTRQFSEQKLEELMASARTDLLPILQNEGFKRIAKAIRQSTVQAQYFRYERNDRRYDVRYGLGQNLAQKAHDAEEFAAALGGFIGQYNAESAQVRENIAKQYKGNILPEVEKTLRGRVSEDDIAELLSLIPHFGSETVCHLLVAVGYSRGSRDDTNQDNVDIKSEGITVEEV